MANLQEEKSFPFGTLQEGNIQQSLKAQSRKGNAEMYKMERQEGIGKTRNQHGVENDPSFILDRPLAVYPLRLFIFLSLRYF